MGLQNKSDDSHDFPPNKYYANSKPLVRWFWFATHIKKEDIKHQLKWVKKNRFGGVEIAWLYPLHRYKEWYASDFGRNYPVDTSAQKWLSDDWIEVVAYTKSFADSLGLACDFTYGSAWPTAGLNIDKEFGTQIFGDTSFSQMLTFSWAWPKNMRVINHLDSTAFKVFSEPMERAFKKIIFGSKPCLFMDSWEIKLNYTNKLWTPGFDTTFRMSMGYDIRPFLKQGLDSFPDVRYDYMMILDQYITNGFYLPFVNKCKSLNTWSRVQCLGAPTDVMTTYSLVDIPETEAMLNNPNYAKIVSSSGALAGKPIISSESFTCMYGFPKTYLRNEQSADLKMVADALFANGVNQHIYIGMPYNPKGSDTIDFFATCYIGPGGSLTKELPELNSYVEKVSGILQKGKTYSDVAVYIPYEDAVMKGPYPKDKQRVWVWGEYELRYVHTPAEIEGYHPLWINRYFLENSKVIGNKLVVGNLEFSVLYIDVKFIDIRTIKKLVNLAEQGIKICLKNTPIQPGLIKDSNYNNLVEKLKNFKNVSNDFFNLIEHPPLIKGDSLPEYWCRVDNDGTKYLFLAQWASKNLEYPVYSGQSFSNTLSSSEFTLFLNGKTNKINVTFKPYQSIMLKISPRGKIKFLDIYYRPKDPIVKPKEIQKMYF